MMRNLDLRSLNAVRGLDARISKIVLPLVSVCAFVLLLAPASVFAAGEGPQWTVSAVARPTSFAFGEGEDSYVVLVTNSGSAANEEEGKVVPVTVTDELPVGLEARPGASAEDELAVHDGSGGVFGKDCVEGGSGQVSCTYDGVVQPDDTMVLEFPVRVAAGAPGAVRNVVRVAGGGASASAVIQTPTSVFETAKQAREATGFGVSPGGATTTLSSVQAGAHPDITTTGAFNTENASGATVGALKNIATYEPPGFALDLIGTPACQAQLFLRGECPVPTQVGVTLQDLDREGLTEHQLEPVYNLAPEPGEVAKIGFSVGNEFHYEGDVAVLPPGEPDAYGGRVTFYNASGGSIDYDGFSLTIWGVPASAIHDPLRCTPTRTGCDWGASDPALQAPFFTNPTACGSEPLHAEFHVTSWQEREPGAAPNPPPTVMAFGPIVGCERLLMEPSLTAEVTSGGAETPTGLDVATKIPQTYENAEGLATSTLKQEVVTLPEGMTVNPSSGAGLQACSQAQYLEETTPEKTAQEKSENHGCPAASKLATVKIKTPLLEEEVTGSVFLAEPAPRGEPGKNPFNALLAVYLVARIPGRGVLIKSPGLVQANQQTGQLTTTFGLPNALEPERPEGGLPPLPFTIATFQFNQGANAPLVTPAACGQKIVQAQLTPWSDPEGAPFEPLVPPFEIFTNCPAGGVPPFAPQLTAGTENAAAGAYSPMEIRIARNDGEQEITGFSSQLPLGLTGDLAGVQQCPEADIALARAKSGIEEEASPSCPAGSEIGQSVAGAGVGPVLVYAPGKLYFAGPFEGAPFSVASVTSAHVGPFDLGTVVVHLPLEINPRTAQVSIPAGQADQIPHIIKGIVIHVREIRVFVNREKFMINPTSCNPLSFAATVIGGGANPANPADNDPVTTTDPFQVNNCSNLKFTPTLTVSTAGQASKANGAGLQFKIAYPPNPIGTQAWFNEAKFDIPKQLPSRLETIQRACLAVTFETNRAACPPASIIGHALVHTPILPLPLEGPVYFVSYGGAKFPDAVMALKGDNVTIELHGETFINNKTGITSATFRNLPDVPFQSIEVNVPTGRYSEFGANLPAQDNYNFCGQKLTMPTLFKASNGQQINQNTPVTITGCPYTLLVTKSINGHTATLNIAVPAAGKLKATSTRLSSATKNSKGPETLTLKLNQKKTGKLNTNVKLTFTPTKGKKLTKTITLNFKK